MLWRKTVNAVEQIASGVSILGEWLGEGGNPVARELAERRSKVCELCPLNSHGKWWERSKDAIAMSIRRYLEVKNRMDIRVSNEHRLFMCSACGCSTALKVHTPIKHIEKHMTAEQFEKLDPNCWIRTEIAK